MADKDDLVTDLVDECRCPLCLELFTEPRVLDCQHTFCTLCLEEIHKRSSSRTILVCPVCREPTALKDRGVLNLPKNYHLANISTLLKRRQASLSKQEKEDSNAMHIDEEITNEYNANEAFRRYLANTAGVSFPTNQAADLQPSAPALEPDTPFVQQTLQFSVHEQPMQSQFFPASPQATQVGYPASPQATQVGYPASQYPAYAGSAPAVVNPAGIAPPPSSPPQPTYIPSHVFTDSSTVPPSSAASSSEPHPAASTHPLPQSQNAASASAASAAPAPSSSVGQDIVTLYGKFGILEERVIGYFKAWIQSLWFAPAEISRARLTHIEPVMIPYWLVNVTMKTKYAAVVRRGAETAGKPVSGTQTRKYSNLLCCAADENLSMYKYIREMDNDWDISFAVRFLPPPPYRSVNTTSIQTQSDDVVSNVIQVVKSLFGKSDSKEEFKTPPRNATLLAPITWMQAFKRVEPTVNAMERQSTITHLTQSSLNATVVELQLQTVVVESSKTLIYLPAFFCHYMVDSTVYLLVFNGQNGRGYGDRPFTVVGKLLVAGKSFLDALGNVILKKG